METSEWLNGASKSVGKLRCRVLVLAVLVPLVSATALRAQCTGVCGDVDSDGSRIPTDIVSFFPYISSADSLNLDLQCANVDDRSGVTLRDWVFLLWDVYLGWSLDCQISMGPFVPMSNPSYRLHYNSVYPAGDTAVTLYIDATFANPTQAVAIVLMVRVAGEFPDFAEVTPDISNLSNWELFAFSGSGTGNIPVGHLMGAFVSFDFGLAAPGRHPLGRAELLMPAGAQARVITLEQVEIPIGSNLTMAHDGVLGDTDAWALNLDPWIVDITGDVSNDRLITASDIIGLVNYVFKSGLPPYPHGASGDVNCSGSVTASDIVELVNYVFKDGLAPCDVMSECTVAIDSWTCP